MNDHSAEETVTILGHKVLVYPAMYKGEAVVRAEVIDHPVLEGHIYETLDRETLIELVTEEIHNA